MTPGTLITTLGWTGLVMRHVCVSSLSTGSDIRSHFTSVGQEVVAFTSCTFFAKSKTA